MQLRLSAFIPGQIAEVFDFLDDPANAVKVSEHAAEHARGIETVRTEPDGRRTFDIRMRAGDKAWVQTIEQIIRDRPTRLVTRAATWTENRNDVVLALTTDRRLTAAPDGTRLHVTFDVQPGKPSFMRTLALWLQRGATRLEFEHQLYFVAEHFADRDVP